MTRKFRKLFCLLGLGLLAQTTLAEGTTYKDLFFDNFGHFDNEHDYTDAFGNKTTTPDTWLPERANVAWEMNIESGMKFDSIGQINDGKYSVIVPRDNGGYYIDTYGSMATWFNSLKSDHTSTVTGEENGGALFMNITANYIGNFFSKTIGGFSKGKSIRFELYCGNMSGEYDTQDPVIELSIREAKTGKLLATDSTIAKGEDGWVKALLEYTTTSNEDLTFEIATIGKEWAMGNDLIIDDIRISIEDTTNDLNIKGDVKVISNQGSDICSGETALFTLDKEYNASTYRWMMKGPAVHNYTEVGTSKNFIGELSQEGSYYVYCEIDSIATEPIKVEAVSCCVNDDGDPMSRTKVFEEDFGYFTDKHTYVDSKGNVTTTPSTYAPERADVSWDLTALTKMKFDSNGQINDGSYGVVAPQKDGGYYQDPSGNSLATWLNGVKSDHSSTETGKDGGAALFLNVSDGFTGVFYSHEIDGLCANKEVTFETYIANLSDGTNPEVEIRIKDTKTGDILGKERATAEKRLGWIRLSTTATTEGESVILELLTVGGESDTTGQFWKKGNDLIIDDIRLYACTPPTMTVYFADYGFERELTIYEDQKLTLYAPSTTTSYRYYKDEAWLFQQSADGENWTNMEDDINDDYNSFDTKDLLSDTTYFRVLVAQDSVLAPIIENANAATYAPCRAYSISKEVKLIRDICEVEVPELVIDPVFEGNTLRMSHIHPDSIATVSEEFWLTHVDEYVIKTDESYGLLWSENEDGPWTEETPVIDSRNWADEYTYYVKQTNGKCASDSVKLIVKQLEITGTGNIANNIKPNYLLEGSKLTVNVAEGSHVALYTPLGLNIESVNGNSRTYDVKGQNIVILVVDGKAYKVVVK